MLTSHKLFTPSAALAVALLATTPLVAQTQPTTPPPPDSRLEDTEIVIEKSRKNELPPAGRNFDKVPFTPPPPQKRQVRYDFPDFRIQNNPLTVQPRVAPIRQEESAPVPGIYAEAGYGNYGTIYGRLGAHTKPSERYRAGLDVRHQGSSSGPIDDKNSAAGNTRIEVNGEGYTRAAAFGGNAHFERDYTHFYGYSEAVKDRFKGKDKDLLQTHVRFGAEASARTADARKAFQAEAAAGFRAWQNNTNSTENDFRPRAMISYAADPANRIVLRGQGSIISYKGYVFDTAELRNKQLTYSRPQGNATLAFEHDGDRVDASLGATFGYSGDTLYKAKKANIYPAVRLALEAVEDRFVILLGVDGAMDRVSLYDLSKQNPWLSDTLRISDTNRQFSAYAGFTLTPARGTRLLVRGTFNSYRNLYFFNPSPVGDSTRYTLEYDAVDTAHSEAKTKNLNVHAELTMDLGGRFQLTAKGDYDNWDLGKQPQPWHRPNWQASTTLAYNIADKVLIGGEVYAVGPTFGQTSFFTNGQGTVDRRQRKTDTVIDVNARLDYRITPKLSIFAMGQNLLGTKYQRYLNYPSRGLTVIGGLGFQL